MSRDENAILCPTCMVTAGSLLAAIDDYNSDQVVDWRAPFAQLKHSKVGVPEEDESQ